MKISELLKQDKVTLSFEVFPPKKESSFDTVKSAATRIAGLEPDFISVTYGAGGGGNSRFTMQLAGELHRDYGAQVLPHLTCVGSTKEYVHRMIGQYRDMGIENIMALRGDLPEEGMGNGDYRFASEMIQDIRSEFDFCIGAACYPEGHVECVHKADDIKHLKEKVDSGCDFLTTQMFFDNNIFYNFLYRIREAGIDVPVLAGIMPITKAVQLGKSVQLSGSNVPERFKAIVDYFGPNPEAMKQAGIIYASEQITDLIANGVKHIHVYTMNSPDVASAIMGNVSAML